MFKLRDNEQTEQRRVTTVLQEALLKLCVLYLFERTHFQDTYLRVLSELSPTV